MTIYAKCFLFLVGIFFFTSGCSSSTDTNISTSLELNGRWQQEGLEECIILKIKYSPNFIYTATNHGIYQQPREKQSDTDWNLLGLKSKEIVDFVVFNDQEIIVGVQLSDIESRETSLFRTVDGGVSWESFQNNFGGKKHYNWITAISKHPQKSSVLYAKGGTINVAKSVNKGNSWQLIFGDNWEPKGFSYFLKIDANDANNIWTGGQDNIFRPSLLTSDNKGKDWQFLTVFKNGETAVYDIETHPSEEDRVLAGLGGGIRKSTDGGQSWRTVLEGVNIYSMTKSAKDERIIYASGEVQSGQPAFFASGDFGDTWQQVAMSSGPGDIFVNDMVSVMENGKEVLYLGTNKGVYSYRFEE